VIEKGKKEKDRGEKRERGKGEKRNRGSKKKEKTWRACALSEPIEEREIERKNKRWRLCGDTQRMYVN
jgi:hypothetical protein